LIDDFISINDRTFLKSNLFLDLPIDDLLGAPYRLPLTGGNTATVEGLPPIWLPPMLAPFVGADISAGMATVLCKNDAPYPLALADMGTNGEFVLALDAHTAYVASVPLGPALEGIGLACGGLAAPGAITGFDITPAGLMPTVMGSISPSHISASGAISLIAAMIRAGLLNNAGQLTKHEQLFSPLTRRLADKIVYCQDGWRLPISNDIYLCAADVENILKVRAAFAVSLQLLVTEAGLTLADVRSFLLAGNLGEHIPVRTLEDLGFLPPGSSGRTRAVGNSSLDGSALLLAHPGLRDQLLTWSRQCRLVEVAKLSDFTHLYAEAMRFAW
jgi:uncharacterized 2Fe-2S/4Fe-4S cluster protein (DUF4445 family)